MQPYPMHDNSTITATNGTDAKPTDGNTITLVSSDETLAHGDTIKLDSSGEVDNSTLSKPGEIRLSEDDGDSEGAVDLSHGLNINLRKDYRLFHPLSPCRWVYIRARGTNNCFLAKLKQRLLMTAISPEQLCQAAFQVQDFWDERHAHVVSTIFHVASQSYLGVKPNTFEVVLVTRPESSDNDSSAGIVALPPGAAELAAGLSEQLFSADENCLFILVNKEHTCIKPVLNQSKSLSYDRVDGVMMTVDGCEKVFKFLSAHDACKFFSKKETRRLLGGSFKVVFVICNLRRRIL